MIDAKKQTHTQTQTPRHKQSRPQPATRLWTRCNTQCEAPTATHLRVGGGAVGSPVAGGAVSVVLGAGGGVVHAGGRVVAPVAPASAALLHLAAPKMRIKSKTQ